MKWPKLGWYDVYSLVAWISICLILFIPLDYFVTNELIKFMIYGAWCIGGAQYVIPVIERKLK